MSAAAATVIDRDAFSPVFAVRRTARPHRGDRVNRFCCICSQPVLALTSGRLGFALRPLSEVLRTYSACSGGMAVALFIRNDREDLGNKAGAALEGHVNSIARSRRRRKAILGAQGNPGRARRPSCLMASDSAREGHGWPGAPLISVGSRKGEQQSGRK